MTDRCIDFQVQWTAPGGSPDPAEDAWGVGRLLVAGETVWGAGDDANAESPGVEWSWADLLDHLAECWPWLMWEQVYPAGLCPVDPRQLRTAAETRWLGLPQERVYAEDRAVSTWELNHYLNAGLGGLYAPGVCVLREGRQAVITALGRVHRVPLAEVRRDLAEIGNRIAERVRASKSERAVELLERWANREVLRGSHRQQIETGLPAEVVEALPLGVAPNDDAYEPICAVARMTRASDLDSGQLADLITTLNAAQRGRLTPAFHALSAAALAHMQAVEKATSRWFDQGYSLGVWLRRELGLSGRVDPAALLRKWGVAVQEKALPGTFDAVALWSPTEAAVIVNENGIHAQKNRGKRATLAHEIAHLLIDRDGALPVADVLGGLAPRHAEARANAFAAEFLAPRAEIEATVAKEAITTADAALKRLCGRYNASQQLVAHQIRNSGATEKWSMKEWQHLEMVGSGWTAERWG